MMENALVGMGPVEGLWIPCGRPLETLWKASDEQIPGALEPSDVGWDARMGL